MRHLWRNKEEIIRIAEEIVGILETAETRRLTKNELADAKVLMIFLESWCRDLPDRLTIWEQLKLFWSELWEKSN